MTKTWTALAFMQLVDEGRVVEVGSHDELLAHGGRYAEMYATWISHLISEWDGEGDGHGPHGPPLIR